jgi:hypothetical protein
MHTGTAVEESPAADGRSRGSEVLAERRQWWRDAPRTLEMARANLAPCAGCSRRHPPELDACCAWARQSRYVDDEFEARR